jgi:ATP-binding cassette, subfamily B (MDR/TAP), member 1
MYTLASGSILFDEIEIFRIDPLSERNTSHFASQECISFEGTVHENVAIGIVVSSSGSRKPEDVTRQEIEDAYRVAMVHDFVKDLPMGYDTFLGAGGCQLSSDQRQRIAIPRAVLRDSTVSFLVSYFQLG